MKGNRAGTAALALKNYQSLVHIFWGLISIHFTEIFPFVLQRSGVPPHSLYLKLAVPTFQDLFMRLKLLLNVFLKVYNTILAHEVLQKLQEARMKE
jgi:hypothetical protein